MSYDPNQPRDDEGQWTAEQAALSRSRKDPATRAPRGPATLQETLAANDAYQSAADNHARLIMEGGSDQEIRAALRAKNKADKDRTALRYRS